MGIHPLCYFPRGNFQQRPLLPLLRTLPSKLALDESLADMTGKVARPPPFLSIIRLFQAGCGHFPHQGAGTWRPTFSPPGSHLRGMELLPLERGAGTQPNQGGRLFWALHLGARPCHASTSSLPHHHRHTEHQAGRDLREHDVQRSKGPRRLERDARSGKSGLGPGPRVFPCTP